MKPGALTYCPRCRKAFVALVEIEPLEPWESLDVLDEEKALTECPRCEGEMQVLQMSAELRAALKANRESEERE